MQECYIQTHSQSNTSKSNRNEPKTHFTHLNTIKGVRNRHGEMVVGADVLWDGSLSIWCHGKMHMPRLTICPEWCSSTDDNTENSFIHTVLTEYSKAFDRINSDILPDKLKKMALSRAKCHAEHTSQINAVCGHGYCYWDELLSWQ